MSSHWASSTTQIERLLLGGLGEQAEDGQTDDEAVRGRFRAEAERGLERITLWAGQSLPQVEQGGAQLMQTRICELHLVLDAGTSRDATPGRALHDVLQQRRLADARLAAHDQDLAVTRPDIVQ